MVTADEEGSARASLKRSTMRRIVDSGAGAGTTAAACADADATTVTDCDGPLGVGRNPVALWSSVRSAMPSSVSAISTVFSTTRGWLTAAMMAEAVAPMRITAMRISSRMTTGEMRADKQYASMGID